MAESTTQEVTEEETKQFHKNLEEFSDSLSELDRQQLAALVVLGSGIEEEVAEGDQSNSAKLPSDEEVKAFAQELTDFHDRLPGNQHVLLDNIVAKVAAKEDEVQGYSHVVFQRWIWAYNKNYWINTCDYYGGDLLKYYKRWKFGYKQLYVRCIR